MAKVLVLYGTTDGHTRKVASRLADVIRGHALEVDLVNADEADPVPIGYAGVIVAASLHAGGYQRSVRRWVAAHVADLTGLTTAFVTVCLGILQHDASVRRDLDRLQGRLLEQTGWQPTVTKYVAGALLYREYNWLKRFVMLRIVRKAGGDTDTSRNYEYTDWNDLSHFAAEYAERVCARSSATGTPAVA
jgi:menaquinone-dependent protoporphyrinogen oxidase